jgi:hypothetical protein
MRMSSLASRTRGFALIISIAAAGCAGGDEGETVEDTGMVDIDTGTTSTDTGAMPVDSGTPEDTGTPGDTGTPTDTGTPPTDTGTAMDSTVTDTTLADTAPPMDVVVDTFVPDTFVPGVITIAPTTGLKTTEAGGTATFTIVLGVKPSADVTIPLTSSDTKEGSVSPASVTFTATNYATAQTITITGVDDSVIDGPKAYKILTGAAVSGDKAYSGLNPADVDVTNDDNDKAGVTVTPTTGLKTNESGGTATFTVVLDTQPTANVTVGLTSSNTAEGTVAPPSLTFTPSNWNTAQTVTITGVDDGVDDTDKVFKIVTAAATSTDTAYAGIDAADVDVTNVAKTSPDFIISKSYVYTTEAGGKTSVTIRLATKPADNVIVPVTIMDPTEGVFPFPKSGTFYNLYFTPTDWDTPQTVEVQGVADNIDDDAVVYDLKFGPSNSTDVNYNVKTKSIFVENGGDDDVAGLAVTNTTGIVTDESGTIGTFKVKLTSEPIASVIVPVTVGDTTEGRVRKLGTSTWSTTFNLTFDNTNWNVEQTVQVAGWDDVPATTDGNKVYDISVGAPTGSDSKYTSLGATVVTVTNNDVLIPDTPGGCTARIYNGHTYWRCINDQTYSAARSYCQSLASTANGGFRSDVVVIDSAGENVDIGTFFPGYYWMGLDDIASEGTFVTISGSPPAYTSWSSGEPNNYGSGEDCSHGNWSGLNWNDIPCDWTDGAGNWTICEVNGTR